MVMKTSSRSYIPALRYIWLTRFYDPVVRLTTRENAFKRALLRQAGIQRHQRILDLGCGTGTLALTAKRAYAGAEAVGFDADAEALGLAGSKAPKDGLEVLLNQGLASALPYASDSFDRVLSSLFFHHLSFESKKAAIKEVLRVLRPSGEFHIADWGKPTSPVMRLAFLGVQVLDGFATTSDSVSGVLPDLMRQAGFDQVETTESTPWQF
jgi:ubiquinone/menaquinone biosynthesis C-methylase UbiE